MSARVRFAGPILLALATIAAEGAGAEAAVQPTIWFVDNSAAQPGDGSIDNPLVTLAEAERRSGPGEWIFIRSGDGSSHGLDTGIRLKSDQTLLGEGVGLEIGTNPIAPGPAPTITNPDGHGVVLADGCEVAGFNVTSTRGAGLFGAEVTDCRLRDLTITSTGGAGIELRDTGGLITLQRIRIDGTLGDGLDLVGHLGVAPARIELSDCRMTEIGGDGVNARLAGSTDTHLSLEGCGFVGIAGTATAVAVEDEAVLRFGLQRSQVVGAGNGVALTVLDSGRLDYRIIDNTEFSGIENTIVNLFVDPDSTAAARASGEISGNTEMAKQPGSGFGIRLSCNGDGSAVAVVRDNRIAGGVDADFGILAEARLGAARLDLELVGNSVAVGADALEAIAIRSRDAATVCARIEGNTAAAAGRSGLRLQQRGESTLALVGLDSDGGGLALVEEFMASANPGVGGVKATADAGFTRVPDGCLLSKETIQ